MRTSGVPAAGTPDPPRPAIRIMRLLIVAGLAVLVVAGVNAVAVARPQGRTTPRYDPPVMAGQIVYQACTGGFYARRGTAVVLTISAHCATPGVTLRDADGRVVGVYGQKAQLVDCPAGRFCSPSDFLMLVLAADRIPWGHLNLVDMGSGGYRALAGGTRPLACADINSGARVEVDGREIFREGRVTGKEVYSFPTDVIFPCMVLTDVAAGVGDSGGAVLVDGLPAGIAAREFDGRLGFTPLAEGLDALGLVLCTTPDCDLPAPVAATR